MIVKKKYKYWALWSCTTIKQFGFGFEVTKLIPFSYEFYSLEIRIWVLFTKIIVSIK